MNYVLLHLALTTGLLCGCVPQDIHASDTSPLSAPSGLRIVVSLRNTPDIPADAFLRTVQQATGSPQVQYATPARGKIRILLVDAASGQSLTQVLTTLRGLPEVEFAEPDAMGKAH